MFHHVPQLHRILYDQLLECRQLPYGCGVELELRLGTLEYSPVDARGKWKNGVSAEVFAQLVSSFPSHLYVREELWDSIYHTVDERSKVRVSQDAAGNIKECICKTWIGDCKLERYLHRYDARLNVSREMDAALPPSSTQPDYRRHKQRLSIVVCDGNWRLDMTRSTDAAQKVQYEVELEALQPQAVAEHMDQLYSDLTHCCELLLPKTILLYNNTANSHDTYNPSYTNRNPGYHQPHSYCYSQPAPY